MGAYHDISTCIDTLCRANAPHFVKELEDGGSAVVCYSPYITVNYDTGEITTHFYVYHWKDIFDKDGNFIRHEVYENTYLTELNYEI